MSPAAQPSGNAPYSYTLRHTLDADEHAACLTNWHQRYDQLTAGAFDGVFEEFCFGRVQLFREGLNQSVHQAGGAWPGSRTFAVPVAIEGTGWFGGEMYDAHSMLTLGGDDELDFRTPRRLEILACTADSAALHDYAHQVDHRNLEAELAGRKLAPTTPAGIAALGQLLATMTASLRATPELLLHPQMRKAMEQALFATLLDTLSCGGGRAGAPSCRARQQVVARARAYMEAHIDEPITVADLCIELGISRRTLQYSFQDVLDLNPVKFLRAIRLNAVRRSLKAADPNGRGTVADIAARWGFWHLSHFSAEYKTMFGELPSDTLRRAG
ncbi:MAG TPA: helix-turn-helix domain-containing protein [Thauera aminoaromatica]|jgi:AraC family ethanolamine operon transcriptional activator|uniref:AraC family transcriptional regulator n=2 Tax=Thauera aminoaromatica TaxID=164330 RepID=N6YTF1_THASP|nr:MULTISPECIES: helix-turn-helix domain-containing protein [Thauera]ACK53531.1 transcriptional regulator, AraC family [Thauera aminoaromatica]ENO85423.1 AraC family transcriptional regulator [Thauera aminoaromatica S2]MBP6132029.1 helix-turn-helix domain-containing protein [Thauera sp.]MBP7048774.1 helix-turn-helix domain-containing protein [Thauera sp.]HMV92306.1 helix-turn-helix domain-containing protein [Thauera aminoaromatica]